MTILQYTKPRHSNKCTRVVPTRGWCRNLRSVTDFALWARKVTAQPLRKAMSTLVVQVRHLWLSLAEMSNINKMCFLDTPVSQAGVFCNTVEDSAQEFSVVQTQTCSTKADLLQKSAEREGCLQAEVSPRIVDAIALANQSCGEPVPLWQTSVKLRAGQHQTPSWEFTVSALSQYFVLTPGPVLVLACPGLRSAPVLG